MANTSDPTPDAPVVPLRPAQAEQEAPTADSGRRLDLRPSGLAVLRLSEGGDEGEERTVRLRRPLFGEFKRLRKAADAMNEAEEEAAVIQLAGLEEVRAVPPPEGAEPGSAALSRHNIEQTKKMRAINRAASEKIEKARYEWWTTAVTLLSIGGDLPKLDEVPAWLLVEEGVIARLFDHWMHRPLARGGGAQQ